MSILDKSEEIMEEMPDSALHIINKINISILVGEENARYSLLKSMALDKNYIDLTDDSLINVAFNYYNNSDNDKYRMLSNYYKGRICYNAGDDESGLYNALETIRLSEILEDTLWMARGNELASDIYIRRTSVKQAKVHSEKAAEYFKKCGKNISEILGHSQMSVARPNQTMS